SSADDDEAMSLDLGMDETAEEEVAPLDLGASSADDDEAMSLDLGMDESAEEEMTPLDLGASSADDDEAMSLDLGMDDFTEGEIPVLDLGDELSVEADTLSLDLGAEEMPASLELGDESSVEEATMALDLGGLEQDSGDEDATLDLTGEGIGEGGEEGELPDLDLDLGLDLGMGEGDDVDEGVTLDLPDGDPGAEIHEEGGDQPLVLDTVSAPPLDAFSAGDAGTGSGFPDGGLELDEEGGLPSDVDEVANKLDLARAFIGMGDEEGARALLEEVMAEGTEVQRRQAQEML
ncbi:FimV/HubP family polar landmark protein, partial [Endothiovibrio diazotrophicus]